MINGPNQKASRCPIVRKFSINFEAPAHECIAADGIRNEYHWLASNNKFRQPNASLDYRNSSGRKWRRRRRRRRLDRLGVNLNLNPNSSSSPNLNLNFELAARTSLISASGRCNRRGADNN